jgi:hypothetical protein
MKRKYVTMYGLAVKEAYERGLTRERREELNSLIAKGEVDKVAKILRLDPKVVSRIPVNDRPGFLKAEVGKVEVHTRPAQVDRPDSMLARACIDARLAEALKYPLQKERFWAYTGEMPDSEQARGLKMTADLCVKEVNPRD